MMTKEILLQLDYLKISKKRMHWNIYFVLATSDPNDSSKMMITTLPGGKNAPSITIRKSSNNEVHFRPEGENSGDGLLVFRHPMPTDFHAQARLWVMHARKSLPEVGAILKDISNFMTQTDDIVSKVGAPISNTWLIAEKAANKGIGGVSAAIEQLPDHRNLGFVNLGEHFGPEFDKTPDQDMHNTLSTGYAEVGWTWEVIEEAK